MRQIVILLLAVFCGTFAVGDDDLQTVRALSDQGLFTAAEAFCSDKFEQPSISETKKILLATELVRSYSRQLLLVEFTQRNRVFQRLHTLETTWLPPLPHYPVERGQSISDLVLAKIMLRLQCAMAYQSLGEYQRLEADAASETNKRVAYQSAQTTLQDALERLKECRKELQAFRQKTGINADAALTQRMSALDYSIDLQQGTALKSSALTLTDEEDRNFVLRQAAEMLAPLAAKTSTDPIIIQCKIEKAACHRLCGELDQCEKILTPLLDILASLTPASRMQIEAEWIRYNIAAGNIAEMRQRYKADRADAKLHPDFELARLELLLASDSAKNVRPEASAALELQQTMAQQLGPYWGRRAAMTANLLSAGNRELIAADMLATLAENAYRENKFVESATYYEQAAAKADANRQAENMFRYNRFAAGAWFKALEQAPAESKAEYRNQLTALLRKLSMQFPAEADADELHLKAIDLQGQTVVSQPELLEDYLVLVKEHIETWTTSPQLQRLRRLLVVLLMQRGHIDEAAALLPILDEEQLKQLPAEIQRLRVRQLDSEGKTEEAINVLSALLEQKRDTATLQLFAEILARQSEEKRLNDALDFWRELEPQVPKTSETWWSAREGIIDVLCKLNRYEEAKKSFDMLRLLYPDLGGRERMERLSKRFASTDA